MYPFTTGVKRILAGWRAVSKHPQILLVMYGPAADVKEKSLVERCVHEAVHITGNEVKREHGKSIPIRPTGW
jgi:hypothetical protein